MQARDVGAGKIYLPAVKSLPLRHRRSAGQSRRSARRRTGSPRATPHETCAASWPSLSWITRATVPIRALGPPLQQARPRDRLDGMHCRATRVRIDALARYAHPPVDGSVHRCAGAARGAGRDHPVGNAHASTTPVGAPACRARSSPRASRCSCSRRLGSSAAASSISSIAPRAWPGSGEARLHATLQSCGDALIVTDKTAR